MDTTLLVMSLFLWPNTINALMLICLCCFCCFFVVVVVVSFQLPKNFIITTFNKSAVAPNYVVTLVLRHTFMGSAMLLPCQPCGTYRIFHMWLLKCTVAMVIGGGGGVHTIWKLIAGGMGT